MDAEVKELIICFLSLEDPKTVFTPLRELSSQCYIECEVKKEVYSNVGSVNRGFEKKHTSKIISTYVKFLIIKHVINK